MKGIILESFYLDASERVQRGDLQEFILDEREMLKNVKNRQLIDEVVLSIEETLKIVVGSKKFYKNIQFKQEVRNRFK